MFMTPVQLMNCFLGDQMYGVYYFPYVIFSMQIYSYGSRRCEP